MKDLLKPTEWLVVASVITLALAYLLKPVVKHAYTVGSCESALIDAGNKEARAARACQLIIHKKHQ